MSTHHRRHVTFQQSVHSTTGTINADQVIKVAEQALTGMFWAKAPVYGWLV